jgi:predicted XRE-type DNA-binding protein
MATRSKTIPTKQKTTTKDEPESYDEGTVDERVKNLKLLPKVYTSVSEMIRDLSGDEFADDFDARQAERRLVRSLTLARVGKDVSQTELAALMGCGQGKVSKMERSRDADLGLGDIVAYAKAIGMEVRLALRPGEDGLVIEARGKAGSPRKRVRKKS